MPKIKMIKFEFVASNHFFCYVYFLFLHLIIINAQSFYITPSFLLLIWMYKNLEFFPQHCFKSFENFDSNFVLIIFVNLIFFPPWNCCNIKLISLFLFLALETKPIFSIPYAFKKEKIFNMLIWLESFIIVSNNLHHIF